MSVCKCGGLSIHCCSTFHVLYFLLIEVCVCVNVSVCVEGGGVWQQVPRPQYSTLPRVNSRTLSSVDTLELSVVW